MCGIACQHIIAEVFEKNNVPEGVCALIIGGREVGEWMANDTRIPLVSATGSTRMGKAVGAAVGARLGRALLNLGETMPSLFQKMQILIWRYVVLCLVQLVLQDNVAQLQEADHS